MLRRTRSSHPWALTTRHPWRVTVRRNLPPPPPDVACPPCSETRCLAPLVRWASERSARCARTDALRGVTWMGCPSPDHGRLDVDLRTKSHVRIHSGGGGSVRRTLTRQGWRVGSDHGWLERVRRTEHPSPVHHPQSAHRTSVARTPSEVGARSSEPMSNVKGPPQSLSIQLIPGH